MSERPPVESSLRGTYPELFQVIDRDECGIRYTPRFRQFSIRVRPEDVSYPIVQTIHFCPFTGKALPTELRDALFDTLEAMGLDLDIFQLDEAPEPFRTEAWWIERGL